MDEVKEVVGTISDNDSSFSPSLGTMEQGSNPF